ncbi:MAG TPA: TonB-dependent receptor [Candidatus Acidoferrales bacterium]|nr:TonB-dependent receptor [Candidatus Acidoferrales bacterium]
MKTNAIGCLLLCFALVFLTVPSPAQTTGTILGTVNDATGAAIAGARITATNLETNVARKNSSAQDGSYSLTFLPLGTYRVEVDASGFKKFEQTGIILDVNRNARVDATLQLGSITETVEVKSDAALVETTRPALGLTVENEDIENLPLVNRDVYSLLLLTPGVDTTGQASDSFGAPMQVTLLNGSPNSGIGSVNYSLDGGSNMNGLRNTGNVAPNPDAVLEFRAITNSYSAEYGRFAGGVVDMVTKSGTNTLHGSLFEFLRNDKLNANRYLPGQSILRKDPQHRNQFGGSVGDRIIKDRTFFFFSYSGLRQRTTVFSNTATPFTAQERTGDLSATGGSAPKDPLNNNAPFPGKLIPVNRFDPVSKKLIGCTTPVGVSSSVSQICIPLPNLPGGLYEAQIPHPTDQDDTTLKLDHTLNAKHQLSGSWFRVSGTDLIGLLGNVEWVTRDFLYHQNNINAGDTWMISPSKVNQFHVQYLRNFGGRVNLPDLSLGDLGSNFNIQGTPSLPQISVSGRISLTSAIPGPVAGSNTYEVRDNLHITSGKHSIAVGGQVQLEKMVHDTLLNNYGVMNFATNNPRGTGNTTADFLLGLVSTGSQDSPSHKIDNGWYYGLFFQDDWRIAPRLTLNLGVRYDLQMPITDPRNKFLTFVPGAQSAIVPSAPTGLLFPGDNGVGRGIVAADKNNISPRIGIAWDPSGSGKTAIRSAFGLFYGSISGNLWNSSSDNQPFAIRQSFPDVKSLSDPYGDLPGGLSPFPYNYSPANPRFFKPASVSGISLDYTSPYSYQMNFSVQRQVGRDMSFQGAYVSTLTHRIPINVDLNYPMLTATATTGNVDSRRPYQPGILSVVGMTKSILNSAYHGAQFTGSKRFSHNFSVKGFYTFSKGIDVINTQNSTTQTATDWSNILLDRGRANNDRTHSFVVSGIWELKYFGGAPVVVRALAGGWSISAISTMRSGTPLTITSGVDTNLDGNSGDRANLIGDPYLDPHRSRSDAVAAWFNTKAFGAVQNGHDGTAGRNILDGPGLKNVDMGIFREFHPRERMRLMFRGEMTNAFNLVNLGNPGTSLSSTSTFGKITTGQPMRQVQLGLRLTF